MTAWTLDPSVLEIDCAAEADYIAARMRELVGRDLRRRGVVGGADLPGHPVQTGDDARPALARAADSPRARGAPFLTGYASSSAWVRNHRWTFMSCPSSSGGCAPQSMTTVWVWRGLKPRSVSDDTSQLFPR